MRRALTLSLALAAMTWAPVLMASQVARPAAAPGNATASLPAPKMPDGKPDLSGVYQASTRRGAWDADTPGEVPGVPAARKPGDVAPPARDPIPFRPEALARARELINRRSVDDPQTLCLPQASPRTTPTGLFPMQIVQTPTQVVMLYEYFELFRVIPIDGRGHPDDVEPTFMGDSVGRWQGDTLVVDVVSFKPGGWLSPGFVHSDKLHLTERYTRVDKDQLNYEVTIDDPTVLTKQYTMRTTLMLREGVRLREYSCAENNLDPKVYERLLQDPSLFLRTPETKP
jgi:hypothetical protein